MPALAWGIVPGVLKKVESCKKPERILVFRGGALGDLLLTLPAMDILRRFFPAAYIELVGYERNAVIALVSGLIDRLRSLDSSRIALYFQNREKLPSQEQEYIRSFDLVISFMHDPEGVLHKNLQEAGATEVASVTPIVCGCHAVDYFVEAIKQIIVRFAGLNITARDGASLMMTGMRDNQFYLNWPRALKEKARLSLAEYLGGKKMIVVHPGSGSPSKNWPAEKFAALAQKIMGSNEYLPVVIGGEADERAIFWIRKSVPKARFVVNMPLVEVASHIAVASGYVGNDSGITHLAAFLGVPVVAFFGPTDPAAWAPRGDRVEIVAGKGGRLDAIEVETAYAKIMALAAFSRKSEKIQG